MRIVSIGGGPAGLYFAILMKKADPSHDILVLERNRPDDTFGFGVVFSDATLERIAAADQETYDDITLSFAHWDDIDIHFGGEVVRSTGHGFSGLERKRLLQILQRRCEALGVRLSFQTEVTDPAKYLDADLVLGADGVNSLVRAKYAETFKPSIEWGKTKFVWLGTTFPFPAFTFYFRRDANGGLWRVHAYRYAEGASTFIVETTEDAWRAAGMVTEDEDRTVAFCERLFAEELRGHRLLKNRSLWRNFPTIRCERWYHGNLVLMGDAVHTAHFSIGSGTKLAMEDSIALRDAIVAERDLPAALARYESERQREAGALQRAAAVSRAWFEETERYMSLEPTQLAVSLLSRSLRVTHEGLKVRDEALARRVETWVASKAARQSGLAVPEGTPPLFTPFKVRGCVLENRVVVSPMCQYSAEDGTPNDWHLVHLGSRAIGGAALVMTEMTNVSRGARISPGCAGMYKPEHVAAWRRIADFVHDASRSKIGVQIGHAGRKGSTRLAWEGMDEPLPSENWPIVSASAIPYLPHSQVPREMKREDMDKVRGEFVRAAWMAHEAGFDWLELHMAHGYLLASFISPLTNVRKDEYGGSLENRMRYPLEVLRAVREVWPAEKPISVRISAVDWAPGGMEAADAVEVARMLAANGCDIVDVSAGQTVADAKPVYGRQFQTPFAERIRIETGIPVMTVGNISSYADVNTIIAAGRADLCVLARAHLYDPYWTRHAAAELGHPLPWPAPYSSIDRYTPRFK